MPLPEIIDFDPQNQDHVEHRRKLIWAVATYILGRDPVSQEEAEEAFEKIFDDAS